MHLICEKTLTMQPSKIIINTEIDDTIIIIGTITYVQSKILYQ